MLAACSPATTFCVGADELADDRESVAQRDGRGPPGRCLPARGRRRVARGHLGRGGRGGRRAGERPARARRRRRATSFALLGRTASSGRSSTSRSALVGAVGAPIYANSSARDTQYVLEHSEAVGVLVEDDEQRAKVAGLPARARDLVRRARRAARARPRLRRGAADGARRARRLDRRGRPLHLHLHVGNDRPAEGLHDPPPQLLRDGAEGRRDGGPPDRARRRDAPLPPARAQLRAPAAPLGGVHRLHDRVPARSAARGDRAAARAADALPERAARLREDPHGRRRRSSTRRRACSAS